MTGSLKWTIQEEQGTQVLRLTGRLDTIGSPLLDQQLQKLRAAGHERFVLNLDLVDYLSSSGLRTILSAAKYAQTHGGRLVLSNVQEQVQDLIHMAGFDTILTIVGSEAEAVSKAKE
jgi:anti-sigma B factor antagonist